MLARYTARIKRVPLAQSRKIRTSTEPALKHVHRAGQNISERYKRLEDSLRSKQSLKHEIESLHDLPQKVQASALPAQTTKLFHAFTVPEEPTPPSDEGNLDGAYVYSVLTPIIRLLHVRLRRLRL